MKKNMNIKTADIAKTSEATISYKQLGFLLISFLSGIVATLLFINASFPTMTSFKTLDLIGFTLSVVLSGASIVLAFAAINLGKNFEIILMNRSDESIRLQNDVYIKTTEALNRIESSTGVTEKRIEDIISGRAGDLSQKIAESTKQGAGPKEIEEQIKQSFRESLDEGLNLKTDEKSNQKRLLEGIYQETHAKIMTTFASIPGVQVFKMRLDGKPDSSGSGLFDGIFIFNGTKIGVSTFRKDNSITGIRTFVFNVLEELAKNNISKIYLIIFKADNEELFLKTQSFLGALQGDFHDKIVLLWDEPDVLIQTIKAKLV